MQYQAMWQGRQASLLRPTGPAGLLWRGMFTGLIEHRGVVAAIDSQVQGRRLLIDASSWPHAARAAAGESIAVSGCCLTLVEASRAGVMAFDVIAQTLSLTTLGQLKRGDAVNLEHAATPSTLLGGHLVQGHVDGVGRVTRCVRDDRETRLRITPPLPEAGALMEFIFDQGSICIDGVSLTVAASGSGWFEVALIPTTLQLTTLGEVREGASVNLEVDCMAKMVVTWLKRHQAAAVKAGPR